MIETKKDIMNITFSLDLISPIICFVFGIYILFIGPAGIPKKLLFDNCQDREKERLIKTLESKSRKISGIILIACSLVLFILIAFKP